MIFRTFNGRATLWTLVAQSSLSALHFVCAPSDIARAQASEEAPAPLAMSRDESVDEWFKFLGNLNNSGMLEPAGSHGSIGLAISAGGSSHAIPVSRLDDSSDSVGASFLERGKDDEDPYYLPRAWLVKGLPWPVDLGLSIAAPKDRAFTQAAAFLQWTVYEAFALPALSIRAGHSRLFGLPGTEIQSNSIDAVASYGFLRYFTLFVAGGATRHQVSMMVRTEEELGFLLQEAEEEFSESRTWWSPSRAVGVRITVLPPFVALTGEVRDQGDGHRSYAVKLGFGM